MADPVIPLLEKAIAAREPLFDAAHIGALRLFNGFLEGCSHLVVDLYATTALLYNHAEIPEHGLPSVQAALSYLQERFQWLRAAIVKTRNSPDPQEMRGKLVFGQAADRKVREHGVWYALDLAMNRDASLYLDTRNLRQWLIRNMGAKTMLNAFAYTGSLGVAACAGGANQVLQLDLNRSFLNLARDSYTLNGFPINRKDFICGDFWNQVSRLKRSGERFDCVVVDPPFFSTTSKGALDLNTDSARLINKVRPLVNDGGWLVSINNALFVSGQAYLESVEALCSDGYLKIAELIPVPEDVSAYPHTRVSPPPADPSPFNHSTKIIVLEVKRKRS